jgi:hypothetical protein
MTTLGKKRIWPRPGSRGFTMHVAKPIDATELVAALANVRGRPAKL